MTVYSMLTPEKHPALRLLSRTKNIHSAKAPFPGFSAVEDLLLITKQVEHSTPYSDMGNW